MTKAVFLKRVDDLFGPILCRVFAQPQTLVEYPSFDSLEGPVLVIRPGGIGDAVMLLPMLIALREALPGREVEVLCESRNAAVLRLADAGLTLLQYDTEPLRVLRRLRAAHYAAVLDSEQYHHFSGVLTAWTRAPARVGFKIKPKRNALYTHLVNYDLEGPEDVQFGRLLKALLGVESKLPPKQGLLSKVDLSALPDALARTLTDAVPLAVVHAGASVPEKCWPLERYVTLCKQLEREHGFRPILVGGARDTLFAKRIAAEGSSRVVDTCGTLTLGQTAALCRKARVFIGPDSGIAHLASAVGTPCVVLFGPSDPVKWGPGEQGRVVQHPVPCGPCAIFGYNKPCHTYACMAGISVENVLTAVVSANSVTMHHRIEGPDVKRLHLSL